MPKHPPLMDTCQASQTNIEQICNTLKKGYSALVYIALKHICKSLTRFK